MKTPLSTFLFDAQGTLSEIGDGLSKKELAKIGWLPLSLTRPLGCSRLPPRWLAATTILQPRGFCVCQIFILDKSDRILKSQNKDTLNIDSWESGLSAKKIQNALASWLADTLPGGYCRITRPTNDLRLILDAFAIDEHLKLPTIKELRRLKSNFDLASSM
jgi:hypothetical protein